MSSDVVIVVGILLLNFSLLVTNRLLHQIRDELRKSAK
jgi:hypothetical protein